MPKLYSISSGTWYVDYSLRGKRFRKSLRTKNRTLAKKIYDDLITKHTFTALGIGSTASPLLSSVFAEYLSYSKTHRSARTYRDTELHVRMFLLPFFGNVRAQELTNEMVEQFTQQMLEKDYHPRTINLRLETLRKVLYRAVDNKKTSGVEQMPCKIKMLPVPDSLPRYAQPQQIVEWMSALKVSKRMRSIVSLVTGISDRDLGFIRKDGYDAHNSVVRFRRPKTTTDIVIPLIPIAVQIIEALINDPTNPGEELFPQASIRKDFYNASKETGQRITPHMLRHTFATWLLSTGQVSLEFLRQILGHKSIKTTERYARLMPEHLRESMKKIELNIDLGAILRAPERQDGRKEGRRWTDAEREAQAERMRGNRLRSGS